MINKSELTRLLQSYIEHGEDQLESDGFLPGLDVRNVAATELLNDAILFGVLTDRVQNDTTAKVTCSETNVG